MENSMKTKKKSKVPFIYTSLSETKTKFGTLLVGIGQRKSEPEAFCIKTISHCKKYKSHMHISLEAGCLLIEGLYKQLSREDKKCILNKLLMD